MDYAKTSKALNLEASEAVSQQIATLQKLVVRLEAQGTAVMADAELRAGLARIARSLGTDPLQLQMRPLSSQERNNRICVAVVEVCKQLREQIRGSLTVTQLAKSLSEYLKMPVSTEEARAAVKGLSVLGSGISIDVLPNGNHVVRSSSTELSTDQGSVLAACDALGFVTICMLEDNLNWDNLHCKSVLDGMVSSGLLWVDLQCEPTQFWSSAAI